MSSPPNHTADNYWHAMFKKREQSKQSIREFCRQENISVDKYRYWRNKLIVPVKQYSEDTHTATVHSTTSKLQEIMCRKATPMVNGSPLALNTIKVTYPNGIEIKLPVTLQTEQLAFVLTTIGGLPC